MMVCAFLLHFLRSESGATAIEYCLICTGIGITLVAGLNLLSAAIAANLNALTAALP
jgi:Flp pilus assembly pilin Flp